MATGKHHTVTPQTLRTRTALVAVVAGACAAAVGTLSSSSSTTTATSSTPTTQSATLAGVSSPIDDVPRAGPAAATADMQTYRQQLTAGKKIRAEHEAAENAKRRPMFAEPIKWGTYTFTSPFAMRWGSFHGGIDLAAPLGTPIQAITDGEVIAAGPASGYGNWVQVRAEDGTVTMYGHMASSGVLVTKGQHVTAGDVIALVGTEGFSTGPHLHLEVWKDGRTKIDPVVWLAAKGVRLPALGG